MRLAVVQHARGATPDDDAARLKEAFAAAVAQGADVLVLPHVSWLDASEVDALVASAAASSRPGGDALAVLAAALPPSGGMAFAGPERGVELESTPLGRTASLAGDGCLDPVLARELAVAKPDAIVLRPAAESELQAEAFLERAIGLTESAAGLVVIAETDGGEEGDAGHGGSAIVLLGEVIAEAQGGDDVLVADVPAPVGPPDARVPVPELPPILSQRLALHRGERVAVDYPADLS